MGTTRARLRSWTRAALRSGGTRGQPRGVRPQRPAQRSAAPPHVVHPKQTHTNTHENERTPATLAADVDGTAARGRWDVGGRNAASSWRCGSWRLCCAERRRRFRRLCRGGLGASAPYGSAWRE
jgi:hypothetical protein